MHFVTGIESVENQQQKGKQDIATSEFDYSDEGEPEVPTNNDAITSRSNPTSAAYFENQYQIVYYSHEGENVTFHCAPKNFDGKLYYPLCLYVCIIYLCMSMYEYVCMYIYPFETITHYLFTTLTDGHLCFHCT